MAHLNHVKSTNNLLMILPKYKDPTKFENEQKVQLAEERVDLVDCRKELNFNPRSLEDQIVKDQALMSKLSSEIKPASKRNYELEKSLQTIDKQIQLFIQNIISVDDVGGGVFVQQSAQNLPNQSPLHGKKKLYEQLFHHLQKNPRYFAALARYVNAREVSDFVKTVVFDMYGDQYDSREERLLLTTFKLILEKNFDEATDIGSLLRANTAITQMLSAYARRGQGLGILREILEKPIREMVAQTSLNLEINPVEVYKQIIQSYEAKMNKPWDGVRNPSEDEAAENKYVKRLIPPRVKQLEYIAEHFLSRIIETVDSIPFGIRWICAQLAELAQKKWNEVDRYQIGGLVGGYIYLRFFNPVIVTPESVHFVDKKLSKTMRRNLILVAKIMQNLSNGVDFRDKYMKKLSGWVDRHREDIQTYFARLIDVDTLADRMDVDKLLENTRQRDYTIQISFNQIFLCHRLLLKHRKEWNPDNDPDDPVLKILVQLGPETEAVKHSENHTINIRLAPLPDDSDTKNNDNNVDNKDKWKQVFQLGNQDPFVTTVRKRVKDVLLNPEAPETFLDQYRNSLRAYLHHSLEWATNNGNIRLISDCEAALSGINKYITQEKGAAFNDSQEFNLFLLSYANEIGEMKRRADSFHMKVIAVATARDTIIDHANYLHTKLQYYQKYLENVREQAAGGKKPGGGRGKNKNKNNTKSKQRKFTHQKLQQMGVIIDVDEEVLQQTKANFNKLEYYFAQIAPDEYEVEVKYRVGFGARISPFPEPFRLSLTKLLEMQDNHQNRYALEMVVLNVKELIILINTQFVKQ